MTNDPYRPISCELHSEYELACMHRERLELEVVSPEGLPETLAGRALDVRTRSGAEYLLLGLDRGGTRELRLDRIRAHRPLRR